jgi:hypothetical protein
MESVLYDAAGHRRSPATMPGAARRTQVRRRFETLDTETDVIGRRVPQMVEGLLEPQRALGQPAAREPDGPARARGEA